MLCPICNEEFKIISLFYKVAMHDCEKSQTRWFTNYQVVTNRPTLRGAVRGQPAPIIPRDAQILIFRRPAD